MLERTAASLEPCGLHRAIPRGSGPLRSQRQLHTAFWIHGACYIEHPLELPNSSVSASDRPATLNASTFLLDFLYPNGALAFMRRWAPLAQTTDSLEGYRYATSPPGFSRFYTSTSRRSRDQASGLGQDEPRDSSDFDRSILGPGDSHFEKLGDLLTDQNPEDVDRVWNHYQALGEESRLIYFRQVLLYLSEVGKRSDAWKVAELFSTLASKDWDDHIFVAGIAAEVNLQRPEKALNMFATGLQQDSLSSTSLVNALDLLLADALSLPKPDRLMDVWKLYPQLVAKLDLDSISSKLKHVASIQNLADISISFHEVVRKAPGTEFQPDNETESLLALVSVLSRAALFSCHDNQVIPLLELTQDPLAYEEYLNLSIPKRKFKLSIRVYQTYRKLLDSTPSRYALYSAFEAYRSAPVGMPFKLNGLDLVWSDWYKFHGDPSRRAYQKFLSFYASQGDKDQVHTLWKEYIEKYADANVLEGDDTFAHLLQVHAVLGEIDEVERIFSDMSDKFNINPNLHCWNILLNSYAKANNYDGAESVFERLISAIQPDQYSYSTMMGMTGARGDLGLTVDLYKRSRSEGVRASEAMIAALIEAYCQNDHYKEAEKLCLTTTKSGIVSTRVWNKLIHYFALKRELGHVNRILVLMDENRVPQNKFTYQELLMCLTLCRQAHHALQLLSVGLNDKIFDVTPDHFYIVMGAFIKTGESRLAVRVQTMMEEYGFETSSDIIFRLIQALSQWKKLAPDEQTAESVTDLLGDVMRAFHQIYGFDKMRERAKKPARPLSRSRAHKLLQRGTSQFQFGSLIYMFIQLKDAVRSSELVSLYRYVNDSPDGVLPAPMLSMIMNADLLDRKFDKVEETWNLLFSTAQEVARSPDYRRSPRAPKISPRHRYILCQGLYVMQQMLFIKRDATGIINLIQQVQNAGFELDSKNWNYHVQILVQLEQYREAFETCEELLMPNWTGHRMSRILEKVTRGNSVPRTIPSEVRWRGSTPRHIRPLAPTFYHLSKGFLDLTEMQPWSDQSSSLLRQIEERCPQTVRAIKGLRRSNLSVEREIFGQTEAVHEDFEDDQHNKDVVPERGE